jgi:hypothetical protein
MAFKTGLIAGLGIGYVLGARAGRERYEQIRHYWEQMGGPTAVHRVAERSKDVAGTGARSGLRVVQRGVEKAGTAVRDRLHTGEPAEDVVNLVEEQSGVAPEKADRSGTQVFRTEGTVK